MYSVSKLAELYKCTKPTIYAKLKADALKEFIVEDKKGLKLKVEGLNVLNVIMAESNVKQEPQQEQTHSEDTERYIRALEEQIKELKQDKEELKQDKDKLFHELTEQRKLLTGEGQRKGFFKRLFS
jgi:predicted RNase H-like nuclease (RuvC/YqgF family)